jgi:hypothetical protein
VHTAVNERAWGLHYDLTEDIWRNARSPRYGEVQTLAPLPVDLLQHLLIHECGRMLSRVSRLIALHGIALVSARLGSGDWQQLLRSAQERREERMLYAPLSLAARYFDCRVPRDVMEQLERGSPPALVAFLGGTDAYEMSFCNPVTASLRDRSRWYWSAGEALSVFRDDLFQLESAAMRRRQFPALKRYPLFVAYAFHIFRLGTAQLQASLRQPSRAWRSTERILQQARQPGPSNPSIEGVHEVKQS